MSSISLESQCIGLLGQGVPEISSPPLTILFLHIYMALRELRSFGNPHFLNLPNHQFDSSRSVFSLPLFGFWIFKFLQIRVNREDFLRALQYWATSRSVHQCTPPPLHENFCFDSIGVCLIHPIP